MSNARERPNETPRGDGYTRRVRSTIKQARQGRPGLVVSARWIADITEDGSIVWTPKRAKAARYYTRDAAHAAARYVVNSRQGDDLRGGVETIEVVRSWVGYEGSGTRGQGRRK